ncbi:hypothetical protein OG299_21665 [Streptomyces sp. NBC_01296]|nr:hypothetical protein OG299_21665 [Streptomyces sp. NBC_01296]
MSARNSCSSTQTTYASRSTAPCGGSAFAYTALGQCDGTSLSSISRGSSGFSPTFRCDRAGSRFTPVMPRIPPVAAPSAFDSPSSDRNGLTVL